MKQLSLFSRLFSGKQTATKKRTEKRKKGDQAEQLALDYLQNRQLLLLQKNFQVTAGEVDLVMQDKTDGTLVFVEVRYRKNADFGGAAASITPKKQQRIIKAALAYQQKHAPQSSMRFDVVAIEGDNSTHNNTKDYDINWIKSAFDGF
jgi:putative endonuclease